MHFARDCLKARDNANIAQESEQKGKLESMLDLDSTSVSEACAMVCTELQYEDASENEVEYGDQGISTEEYEKATYDDLMKTQSEEEEDVKCTVAQQANDSVILERKRRHLIENDPDKKSEDYNQSDAPINEISTVNSINESMSEVQGPKDDNNKNESRKVWTMEMLMNGGDISVNTTNEEVSMSDDEKMFLYTRAVHSNHSIQYHMHQTMERQRVVDKYRNMTMEGMHLIPLESNLHKFHLVIISQIINMIESDNFWHRKTFESVMSDLRNMWTEGIRELEHSRMYCTNNDENNNEMDGVEVIDLCSVSQSKSDTLSEGKESAKQESWDKSKHDGTDKMEDELKTVKSDSTTKNNKVESTMMCWELTSGFLKKRLTKNQRRWRRNTSKRRKCKNMISIEEFSWEREADASTLETEEPNQQQVVYITNL